MARFIEYGLLRTLETLLMANNSWAMYSKESDSPIWYGENLNDLIKIMAELNRSLGDKFYLDLYVPEEEGQ